MGLEKHYKERVRRQDQNLKSHVDMQPSDDLSCWQIVGVAFILATYGIS